MNVSFQGALCFKTKNNVQAGELQDLLIQNDNLEVVRTKKTELLLLSGDDKDTFNMASDVLCEFGKKNESDLLPGNTYKSYTALVNAYKGTAINVDLTNIDYKM